MSKKIAVGFVSVMFLVGLLGFGAVNYASAQNLTFTQIIDILIAIGVIPADKIAAARAAVAAISVTPPATSATTTISINSPYPDGVQCSSSDFSTVFNAVAVRFDIGSNPGGNFQLVTAGNGQTGAGYKECRIWIDYSVSALQLPNGMFIGPGTKSGNILGFGSQMAGTGQTVNLTITTPSPLSNTRVGSYYRMTLDVSGIPSGFTSNNLDWSVSSGTLPPGLVLSASDLGEIINGITTVAGTYNFSITAGTATISRSNPSVNFTSVTKSFILIVDPVTVTAPQIPLAPSVSATSVSVDKSAVQLEVGESKIVNVSVNISTSNSPQTYYGIQMSVNGGSWQEITRQSSTQSSNSQTDSVRLNENYTGTVAFRAYATVNNGATYTYSSPTNVTVAAPQTLTHAQVDLKANGQDSLTVSYQTPITLAWTFSGSSSCERKTPFSWATNGIDNYGSSPNNALAIGTYTFTVYCLGSYGVSNASSDSVTVTVTAPVAPTATGPVINSFSVTPASVTRGENVTFSGNATTQAGYCITKHRAIVDGSATPSWNSTERWTNVGCEQSVDLSGTVGTAVNPYAFYEGRTSYEVIWQVQDSSTQPPASRTQTVTVNPAPTSMNSNQSNLGSALISFEEIMKLLNALR